MLERMSLSEHFITTAVSETGTIKTGLWSETAGWSQQGCSTFPNTPTNLGASLGFTGQQKVLVASSDHLASGTSNL